MKYLRHSDISLRLNLNPFNWIWLPQLPYEGPTAFYPKRRTFGLVWLFIQLYIDIDNGTTDMEMFNKLFQQSMDAYDEREVGPSVSPARPGSVNVE